jgi:hypothetical protein
MVHSGMMIMPTGRAQPKVGLTVKWNEGIDTNFGDSHGTLFERILGCFAYSGEKAGNEYTDGKTSLTRWRMVTWLWVCLVLSVGSLSLLTGRDCPGELGFTNSLFEAQFALPGGLTGAAKYMKDDTEPRNTGLPLYRTVPLMYKTITPPTWFKLAEWRASAIRVETNSPDIPEYAATSYQFHTRDCGAMVVLLYAMYGMYLAFPWDDSGGTSDHTTYLVVGPLYLFVGFCLIGQLLLTWHTLGQNVNPATCAFKTQMANCAATKHFTAPNSVTGGGLMLQETLDQNIKIFEYCRKQTVKKLDETLLMVHMDSFYADELKKTYTSNLDLINKDSDFNAESFSKTHGFGDNVLELVVWYADHLGILLIMTACLQRLAVWNDKNISPWRHGFYGCLRWVCTTHDQQRYSKRASVYRAVVWPTALMYGWAAGLVCSGYSEFMAHETLDGDNDAWVFLLALLGFTIHFVAIFIPTWAFK